MKAISSEDFGLPNARRLLDKYRPHLPCFNDDVQGTGCVTLAAILAGLHVSKVSLKDVRVVVFGSGTAGTGIADQLVDAIATEGGKPREEASKQIWCVEALQSQSAISVFPLANLIFSMEGASTSQDCF
jgi:malate dehydrogenase (oxaloacetate-decarboxylating)